MWNVPCQRRALQSTLLVESLESRDVPSATTLPGNSLVSVIAPTNPIAETATIAPAETIGTYKVASPNGKDHVTIDVKADLTVIHENGAVIWRGKDPVGNVLFSPNSQHLAIAVDGKDGWKVIEDGVVVGKGYESLSQMTFSSDGKRLAFVAQEQNGQYVVVEDGKIKSGEFTAVQDLQFSPVGDHLAYIGYESRSMPVGIVPMFVALTQYEVSGVGEWGFRSVLFEPDAPTPTSPEVIVDKTVVGGPYQTVTDLSFNSSATDVAYTANGATVTEPVP